jgi:hypothetical protein
VSRKKKQEVKKIAEEDQIESIEWKEVTYTCKVRGTVTQLVKHIKYKTQPAVGSSAFDYDILSGIISTDEAEID